MIYDIDYSITAHENFNILNQLIDNILKFNKEYNVLICLNLNKYMYENKKNIKMNNVIINTIFLDKNKYTSDILKAHIDNFQFLLDQNIKFNNIMLLASNCMFIKQFKLPDKNIYNDQIYLTYFKDNDLSKLKKWHWSSILENEIIINILINNKIKIVKGQHEGRLYNFKLYNNIYNFIKDYNILNLVEKETVFEEFLLQSLEHYYNNGNLVPVYCRVFWERKDYTPNINDIHNCLSNPNIFAVKRIPLDSNNLIRCFINILR